MIGSIGAPFVEFRYRVEGKFIVSFGRFDDRRDEDFQKRRFDQRRPIVVNEIDDEPFDVRAVLWWTFENDRDNVFLQTNIEYCVCKIFAE